MNTIRSIQALNQRELEAGVSDAASWHADYADTAYIYIGGLPFELSEGDILTIFSQFGEPVHVNLVRDKETGKSRGFAFLKYEDQRSTNLAVDNLSGATILGRTISVDHHRYKHKEGEDAAMTAGGALGGEGGIGEQETKGRRRSDETEEEEGSGEETRPPTEKERELMKLMRNMDEDDPMKEYLIKQKKEEIELEKLNEKKKPSRRSRSERAERKHKHRSHRHKSPSDRGRYARERDGDKDRDRDRDRERTRDKDRERERNRDNCHDRSKERRKRPRGESEERHRSPQRDRERRHRS